MKRVTLTVIVFLWSVAAGPLIAQGPGSLPPEVAHHGYADLILVNGKLVSMDDPANTDNPGKIYKAMAVKSGHIQALGTDDSIRRLASKSTQVIDLKGRTVIPGLIETHSHIYNIERWARELGIPLPRQVGIPEGDTIQQTRDNIQKALKEVSAEVTPGQWIVAGMMPNPKTGAQESYYWASEKKLAHKEFLDAATRRHPVLLRAGVRGFVNSAAMKQANATMPGYSDFINQSMGDDADQMGWLGTQEMAALQWEIFLGEQPIDKLAEGVRRTLETYATSGWTTFSTRIPMPSIMSAFVDLDRNGKMPIRLGGHFETHRRAAPPAFTRTFYNQTGALYGMGSDYFWITGVASERWDSIGPEACLGPDISASKEIKARERCPDPGTLWWDVLKTATEAGWRPAGVHGVGSHAVRLFLQMLDKVREEKGWSVEYIRNMHPTVEHATVIGIQPDVIAKMKEYGVIVSAGPGYIAAGHRLQKDYGPKLEPFIVPVRTLMDAGIEVVGELEASPAVGFNLKTLIDRKVGDVYVNKGEAIDRVRALKMWTRWAADYVMKTNQLGSFEVGKFADFVILDEDYFEVPVEEIPKIVPLMTVVGGKPAFLQRDFAREIGREPVGYQTENPHPWDQPERRVRGGGNVMSDMPGMPPEH